MLRSTALRYSSAGSTLWHAFRTYKCICCENGEAQKTDDYDFNIQHSLQSLSGTIRDGGRVRLCVYHLTREPSTHLSLLEVTIRYARLVHTQSFDRYILLAFIIHPGCDGRVGQCKEQEDSEGHGECSPEVEHVSPRVRIGYVQHPIVYRHCERCTAAGPHAPKGMSASLLMLCAVLAFIGA